MSYLSTTLNTAGRPDSAVPWWRWCALVSLLSGEVVFITTRFESDALGPLLGDWAKFAWAMPQLMRLAAVVVATCALVGGRKLLAAMQDVPVTMHVRSRAVLLVVHLACFGLFTWVTKEVLEPNSVMDRLHPFWLVAWCASAIGVGATWTLSLWPASAWRRLAWHGRWGLAAGSLAGVAVWSAGLIAQRTWRPLAAGTLYGVLGLLRIAFSDCVFEPDDFIVGTSLFAVQIAPECSGYEGVGLITAFVAVFLWLERRQLRFPNAFVLFPIAVVAAWLGNIVRIALLVAIGSIWSPSVARGGFHSQAGWIAFVAIALAIVASAGRFAFFSRAVAPQSSAARNLAVPYLVPFLATVAMGMITGSLAEDIDWLYGARVLVAAGLVLFFWKSYGELGWSLHWHPLVVGAAAFIGWMALVPLFATADAGPPEQLSTAAHGAAMTWIAFRTAGYLITAPLVEELAFRGFLLRRFESADFAKVCLQTCRPASLIGSSLCFGAFHGRLWLPATVAGILFAIAACRRGCLADAVLAHATTNALVVHHVFSTGAWSLWG